MDLLNNFMSTFVDTILYILGEFLPAALAIGLLLTLAIVGTACVVKYYQRKDYDEQVENWDAITESANKLITELPTNDELCRDFTLHTIVLPAPSVLYKQKFDAIVARFDEAQSRYAREQKKHDYRIPKTFHSIVASYNEYFSIVTILRNCLEDIEMLWREIDDQSVELTEPTVVDALKSMTPLEPKPRINRQGSRNRPLIYDDTFGADMLNTLFLRPVYREPRLPSDK